MLNAREIAAAALDPETRLAGFVMGTNDLAKDTRARLVPGRAPMLPWLMNCVAAARAYGLDILDGVYNELGNAEGFAAECRAGARSRLRRQDAHSSAADRALQRGVLAERGRGGMVAEDHRRVSSCRRTTARASSRSTAAWSRACMPTWRGGRWRSPTRSRRARPHRFFVQSRVNSPPAMVRARIRWGITSDAASIKFQWGGVLVRIAGQRLCGTWSYGVWSSSSFSADGGFIPWSPNARSASRWFAFMSIGRPPARDGACKVVVRGLPV